MNEISLKHFQQLLKSINSSDITKTLAFIKNPDEQQILISLLHLDENDNLYQFIETHFRSWGASIIVWTALNTLRINITAALNLSQQGLDDQTLKWLNLIKLSSPGELNDRLAIIPSIHATQLTLPILQPILNCWHKMNIPAHQMFNPSIQPQEPYISLLNDIINLPSSTDFLPYIENKYSRELANEIIRRLTEQLSMPGLLLENQWKWYSLNQPPVMIGNPNKGSIVLRQIGFVENGFTLKLSVQISKMEISKPNHFLFPEWAGYEMFADEHGHQYSTVFRLPEGKGLSWRLIYGWQLICFPALADDATKLYIDMNSVQILLKGTQDNSAFHIYPSTLGVYNIGYLRWRINLPNR